ncbi:MAG: hypothetical protein ACXWXF_02065 [Aeromicrobium sp.]
MMVVVRVVTGILLLAHGLVHLLYLASDVREFSLDRSWLVPETARRPLGIGLMAATVAAFALLALAVWGVPGLSAAWPAVTMVATLLSALLLILFWNTWLALGLAIDLALMTIAVLRPHWAEQLVGGG